MSERRSNQEFFVGLYRNAVPPLEWMPGVREAATRISSQIDIVPDEKIRIHEITTNELDRADVSSYDQAVDLASSVLEAVHTTFHDEITVFFGALNINRIGASKKRELVIPVLLSKDLLAERASAIRRIPWRHGEEMPDPDDFDFRIRLGTVFSPTLNGDTIMNKINPKLPRQAKFQKGKIKTLE